MRASLHRASLLPLVVFCVYTNNTAAERFFWSLFLSNNTAAQASAAMCVTAPGESYLQHWFGVWRLFQSIGRSLRVDVIGVEQSIGCIVVVVCCLVLLVCCLELCRA